MAGVWGLRSRHGSEGGGRSSTAHHGPDGWTGTIPGRPDRETQAELFPPAAMATVKEAAPCKGTAAAKSGRDGPEARRWRGRSFRVVRAGREACGKDKRPGGKKRCQARKPFRQERLGRSLFLRARGGGTAWTRLGLGDGDGAAKFARVLPVKSLPDGDGEAAAGLRVLPEHPSPGRTLQHGPLAARQREEGERRAEKAEFAEHGRTLELLLCCKQEVCSTYWKLECSKTRLRMTELG